METALIALVWASVFWVVLHAIRGLVLSLIILMQQG